MDRADQLLAAHTEFVLRDLRGSRLQSMIEHELNYLLDAAHNLRLEDVVTREQVSGVAIKYVSTFDLPGAIPELVGEIALRVRTHADPDTVAGDVLGRPQVDAILRKIAEVDALRERVAGAIVDSPTVQQWLAEYLRGAVTNAIATNRRRAERLPGMSAALSFGERLAGAPLREADQLSREAADRGAAVLLDRMRNRALETLTDDILADALRDVWAELAGRPIAELIAAIDEDDLVDAVVLTYELWLELRTSPYLHSLITIGVDLFFDTYGAFPLDELLAEFGLSREDLLEEALRFGPPAVAAIDATGLLADGVRHYLEQFYRSPQAQALLEG